MSGGLSEYERGFNSGAESTEKGCHEQMNRERDRMASNQAARDLAIARAVRDVTRYSANIMNSDDNLRVTIAQVDASLGGVGPTPVLTADPTGSAAAQAAEPPGVFRGEWSEIAVEIDHYRRQGARAAKREAVGLLMALTTGWNASNDHGGCWCAESWDSHDEACQAARAYIAAAEADAAEEGKP